MSSTNASTEGSAENKFRLPVSVVPVAYDILFHPNPNGKSGKYRGEETITLKIEAPTSSVKLNVCEIDIHEVTITRGSKSLTGKVTVDAENEVATIEFPKALRKGKWRLWLRFTGHHNHKLRGWYKSTWEK